MLQTVGRLCMDGGESWRPSPSKMLVKSNRDSFRHRCGCADASGGAEMVLCSGPPWPQRQRHPSAFFHPQFWEFKKIGNGNSKSFNF